MLKAAIQKAIASWQHRTSRSAPANIGQEYLLPADSTGARAAEAALGREALSAIIAETIGEGWHKVESHVLTGGYSGAYVLRVEGNRNGAPRSVICKISNSKSLLELELSAWRRALEAYSNFIGLIPPLDATLKYSVGAPNTWFIVQSNVPGETLIESLHQYQDRSPKHSELPRQIEAVISRLEEYTLSTIRGSLEPRAALPVLALASIDVHRFESSIPLLVKLRSSLVSRGYLDDEDWHQESEIQKFLGTVVKSWPQALADAKLNFIPLAEQHGDLNPRNIILTAGGPQLIDWARFDSWPVGYDLVRLELQISLRCIGYRSMGDYFPDVIGELLDTWSLLDQGHGNRGGLFDVDLVTSVLRAIRDIQEKLKEICLSSVPKEELSRVLDLCRTFDAIKMCSYQDASPFKRLWCLLIALRCSKQAGLMKS